MTTAVLFVCLGNICRSPLAEAAFHLECDKRGITLEIDSAGTSHWHVGNPPDRRAQAVSLRHGIDIRHYRARQICRADFYRFCQIVAMDGNNLLALQELMPADATASVSLLLDWVPGRVGQPVIDPYYGEASAFETTWADVTQGAAALADALALSSASGHRQG